MLLMHCFGGGCLLLCFQFESRYLDGLVGAYPEDEIIYKERSPIESVDKLSCPILLLQGDEDKVNQRVM
jgi:hypothetical protein